MGSSSISNTTPVALIGNLVKFINGDRGKNYPSGEDFKPSGIPFIGTQHLSGGRIDTGSLRYISREKYDVLNGGKTKRFDILYCLRGQSLGRVGVVEDIEFGTIASSLVILRCRNPADSRFLYYVLSSDFGQHLASTLNNGSAQPNISATTLGQQSIPYPEADARKSIAHILGTLDDKIELNRRMNETLESMARALFKSWFVDFDPVIDNALAAGNPIPEPLSARAQTRRDLGTHRKPLPTHIQKLFPNAFVFDDEIGWIPEGWKRGKLADVCFVKGGYAFKSKDFTTEGWPVVKIKNINSDRTIDVMDVQYIPDEIAEQSESFWLRTGDLLMAMTGATVGKYGLLVLDRKETCLLNQRVAKFLPLPDLSNSIWFSFCLLCQGPVVDHIVSMASGSAQPNISADSIMDSAIVVPTEALFQQFELTVDPWLKRIFESTNESRELAKLRDTLLPQLLSGELRIPDAEKLVASNL